MKNRVLSIGVTLLAALLSFAWPALATITMTARGTVHNINNAKQSTLSVTASTGSSIIVGAANAAGATVTSITWTGCTFTAVDTGASASDGAREVEIWSCHNVTGGTQTLTVNWSANSTNRDILADEFAPSTGTIVFQTGNGGTGSSKSGTTTNITCTPNSGAQCAWFAISRQSSTTTCVIPTGTDQTSTNSATCNETDNGAVTQGASFSYSTTGSWAVAIASYREPAAGTGPPHGLSSHGAGMAMFLPEVWFLHPIWLS